MVSTQTFVVEPAKVLYFLKNSERLALVLSVSGLYEVIIRMRSFLMSAYAIPIWNMLSRQHSTNFRMIL